MLKKTIVCANLGFTIGQQASNSMNLGLPPQVMFYFEINMQLKFVLKFSFCSSGTTFPLFF